MKTRMIAMLVAGCCMVWGCGSPATGKNKYDAAPASAASAPKSDGAVEAGASDGKSAGETGKGDAGADGLAAGDAQD